ncbi:MAG: phasin family protein [Roseibium sp.]
MTSKRNSDDLNFKKMLADWPMPDFSSWAFAARGDQLEDTAVAGFQKMNDAFLSHAEKAFDAHMKFVSHRLQEDFEYAKSLSSCTAPEETLTTLQTFCTKMSSEYQSHFEKQAALLRDSFTENAAVVDELNETAMETVSEFGRAVEETIQDVQKPQAKKRSKTTTKRKSS